MRLYHSIKFRLVAGILFFGLLMVMITGGITFFIAAKTMRQLMKNQVETASEYYLDQYEHNASELLPQFRHIRIFKGLDQVPGQFRPFFQDLVPGIHSLKVIAGEAAVHVGVISMPDTKTTSYILYDTDAFLASNDTLKPEQILLVALGLSLVPGVILGLVLFRVMFKPINELTRKIRDLRPDRIPGRWEAGQNYGEIVSLNQTLELTMNRIREFIEREKQFTRDASHELRTPLTVVKGAVEIIDTQLSGADTLKMSNPLRRIRRSIKNMENLIETFLWLAREENPSGKTALVGPAVEEAVENNRYLIENKMIDVKVDIRHNARLPVQEEILYITVANLIRNAFQFTSKGSVSIVVEKDGLSVTDSGKGIDPAELDRVTLSHVKGEGSQGFGLGLNIVSRLCDRFGWTLDIHSGHGTQIKIKWSE